MNQTGKKLRQCKNLNFLVISSNKEFIDELNALFSDVKLLKIVNSNDDAIRLSKITKFDILIVELKNNNFIESFNEIKTTLKFVIVESYNNDTLLDSINFNIYSIFIKPLNLSNLKLSILMSLNQQKRTDKVILGQGFYFDIYRDRIYNRFGNIVELTKLELGLLKLIIENKSKIVDYDMIEKNVWKNKKMSIFTMRNVVGKIRTKTFYDIFQNSSSKGYIIK
jgi:DNA-binding response OmpR family regulator